MFAQSFLKVFSALAGALAISATAPAFSQSAAWPSKPIRFIVPFAPGGPVDNQARPMAQRMSEVLGQPVVVENVGGGGGTIGTQRVARSAPDGYTIGYGYTGNLAIAPHVVPNAGYDPLKDFTPIGMHSSYENLLVVRADSPFTNVESLLKAARERPGQLTYGSAGIGASNHLSGELLSKLTGAKFNHIAYRGRAPASNDLLAGQIDFMFNTVTTGGPMVKDGRLRALANTGAERHPFLPQVPTLGETVPGYEFSGWSGLVAPAGLPPEIAKRLADALKAYISDPAEIARLEAMGERVSFRDGTEMRRLIERDNKVFSELVKQAGLVK